MRARGPLPPLAALVVALLATCRGAEEVPEPLPEGFIIGAGTSSYQVEGAWNVSGKGLGFFDNVLHAANMLQVPNADVASDSYHRFKDDVAAARELKLQMYRFSLSWPRLLPDGTLKRVNEDGLRYYNQLIDELKANGIEPMVTLFHFDSPQALMDEFDGWNSDKMIEAFEAFADFAFSQFGTKVRYWTTHNEPYLYCNYVPYFGPFLANEMMTGDTASRPPGQEAADYECLHRVVLSHGRVYRLYQDKYATAQGGILGLSNFAFAPRPNSTSYADVAAARRYNLLTLGTTFAPLVTGDYPVEVRRMVDEASAREGLNKSRLPLFTAAESAMLKGSLDFIGVNNYVGQIVAAADPPKQGTMMTDAAVINLSFDKLGVGGIAADAQMTPWSLTESALWLWNEYRVPIFVTENGFISEAGPDSLRDEMRAVYHSAFLRELLRSMKKDGMRVLGYLAWSLIDLYELARHYNYTYGLVHVDFAGGSLNRTLKQSSSFFKELAEKRAVPVVTAASAAPTTGFLGLVVAGLLFALRQHFL